MTGIKQLIGISLIFMLLVAALFLSSIDNNACHKYEKYEKHEETDDINLLVFKAEYRNAQAMNEYLCDPGMLIEGPDIDRKIVLQGPDIDPGIAVPPPKAR